MIKGEILWNIKQHGNQNTPLIKRTINGQDFPVLIHFKDGSRESVQEKVKRILRADV